MCAEDFVARWFFLSVIIVRGRLSRLNTVIEQSRKYSNNAVNNNSLH